MEYGSIAATRGSADKTEKRAGFSADVQRALFLYSDGDRGELCEEDKEVNEWAIHNGERVLAAYGASVAKTWIVK